MIKKWYYFSQHHYQKYKHYFSAYVNIKNGTSEKSHIFNYFKRKQPNVIIFIP